MEVDLIAACGMNCGVCHAYIREKNSCPGCRNIQKTKSKYIRKCIIRNCNWLKKNKRKFCSDKCEKYPCQRLKNLDKRYRLKYGMSMLENLENIDAHGIKKFINMEKKRWVKGSKVFCVHKKQFFKLK